jgi:hypothetical protein
MGLFILSRIKFTNRKEEKFLYTLMNKLNVKKRSVLKEHKEVQSEIEGLKNKSWNV